MAITQCCYRSKTHSHSEQLLNHIVDCIAAKKPETLYAEFPISQVSHEARYLKFTYGKFANAINRIAWWLHDTIGQGKNLETLAYFGPNDLTYPSIILGAILLLSPQNTVDAQLNLLKATHCKILLVPKSRLPTPKPIFAVLNEGLPILEVPTVDELLQPRCRAFPYPKTFEEAQLDPLVILHTSGSTGLPKPITWVQGFASAYAKQLQLDPPAGYENVDHHYMGNRVVVAFPPSDATYVAHVLINAICNQTVAIIPLEGTIPSANPLLETLKITEADLAFVVPGVIEEMSQSPDLLADISSRIPLIAYSGGEVPQGYGDIVSRKVPLINFYAMTEGASIGLVRKEDDIAKEDWRYLAFHPDSGAEFRQYAEDIHELFIVRKPGLEHQHQIFTTFRDVQEYRTKDLYIKHPSKVDLWHHVGRADDTIVFLTGERINPAIMEQNIFSRGNEISGVLVVGSQRFQALLLLELTGRERVTALQKSEDVARIWPFIEEVNRSYPAHARIAKTHIILTDPGRPLPRSPRGTIQRAAALAEYANEINALYSATQGVPVNGKITSPLTHQGTTALTDCVRRGVLKITKRSFEDDENFFVGGMDSLQVLQLARDLKTNLEIPGLGVGVIYDNPSISSLANILQQAAAGRQIHTSDHKGFRRGRMNALLREYKILVDGVIPSATVNQPSTNGNTSGNKVVFLTGSTGALGSYLLQSLLATSDIAHIYCSNEGVGGGLKAQNSSRMLTTSFPADRVTFLTVDYAKPSFGLEQEAYFSLQKRVSCIIHNAWLVNLNIPLSSFLPHLQGLVNLIGFAASGQQHPSILFISSTSAVSSFDGSNIPEEIIYDSTVPAATGYGESKYLAERILHYSARRLSIKTQIARLGQIAGPVNGKEECDKNEWLPSIIRSSQYIGAVPESLGSSLDSIDWIPIDVLAQILMDLMGPTGLKDISDSGAVVYNILNPHPVNWNTFLSIISQGLSSVNRKAQAKAVSTVSLDSWISRVKKDMKKIDGTEGSELETLLKVNPALKLVRFYEDAMRQQKVNWAMDKAKNASQALRGLEGVKGAWIKKWMKSWLA
ncbi:uncharacterized protein BP5553_08212 [Venustampulla echinocandica]|uniref:Carrier domain-containing protein n=1 Tax=Venustampulla echinocandica TaxID=2656787 RepID=A0A370TG16_9HELO|nr:uncharacterized protein BP5553_08212 [Venustampulla echinocandica]RDL33844.1 hypothetical protein BP5553_08212 [Venustampulla echinocandica]